MAHRLAEMRFDFAAGADGAHGEQRDFVFKVDEALDDDAPLTDAPALHGVVPGLGDVVRAAQQRLSLAG
jgi:hypothetical protein